MEGIGNGFLTAVVIICLLCVLLFWGAYELGHWILIDDSIRVSEPIIPKLEIVVEDNVIDTVYVYRRP